MTEPRKTRTPKTPRQRAETWRAVPDFPGYEVSDQGQVRSWHPWRQTPLPRLLVQSVGSGYSRVTLYKAGQPRLDAKVYRLVLLAFVGPRPPGMVSRHLNDNGLDNRLANLAYGTYSDNQMDRVRLGNHPSAVRTACAAGHTYPPDLRRDRKGARVCTECQRIYGRAYKRRRALRRQEIAA